MASIPGLRRFFRIDRSARRVVADVDDELRFHFDMKVQELVAGGMSPTDARAEAARRFGDVERTRLALQAIDRGHAQRRDLGELLGEVAQDLRYAARGLRLHPGFAAVALLTLALGIGANATMFGVVDQLLLRPPAQVRDADGLRRIYVKRRFDGFLGQIVPRVGFPTYVALRDHARSVSSVASYIAMSVVLGNGEQARELRSVFATGNYFQALGVRAAVGRVFGADEDRVPRGTPVAVISDGLWHSQFAGGDVLGKSLVLDGQRFTIIGVGPPGFSGIDLERVDLWLPLAAAAPERFGQTWHSDQDRSWLVPFARLRPGVSVAQADDDLTSTVRASLGTDTAHFDYGARFSTAPLSLAREPAPSDISAAGSVATWLAGVSLVVLLIACANVANLLLARALRRRREIAVRLALGIGRPRLVRQLLTESMLLAGLGGALGVLAAHWGGRIVRAVLLPDVSWSASLFDPRVLGFAAAATLLTGILTGVAPALQAGARDLTGALKAGTREGTVRGSRLRTGLLIAQAALSVVLLVGAGLFVRSLRNIRTIDFGFDPKQVLVARATYPDGLPRAVLQQSDEAMLDRLRQLSYVERAAIGVSVPFRSMRRGNASIPGFDDSLRAMHGQPPLTYSVTPDYFATVGTRIVRGRGFTAADGRGAPRVVVVNETMARRVWRGQDPLGKCMKVGGDTMPCGHVIGIAQDIVETYVRQPPSMQYYIPLAQDQIESARSIFARTRGEPEAVVEAMRRELSRAAPAARYVNVRVMQSDIEPQVRPWRLGASMFSVFGALALLLAAVGLYSVIAYGVTQRTHELGVRVALGARTGDVLRLVVGEGLRVAVVGVSMGAAIALFAGRWLAPLLFGVSPKDPAVFAAVTLVLLTVALAASLLPALRATKVDPATALRAD